MHKKMQYRLKLLSLCYLILSLVFSLSYVTYAYMTIKISEERQSTMNIDLLFGRLDPEFATGTWGSDGNPYLINEARHLNNLYTLQNRSQTNIITKDSIFQVSDSEGKPVFVGGQDQNNLFEINSIGNEDFPFISTFRGVQTSEAADFIVLPSGELSDTSALGNIQVNALPGQSDIGIFGNVGPISAPEDEETIGYIRSILAYNIKINTSSVGTYSPAHRHFVTSAPYESNHIGIVIGHAQFTRIKDISVYYSATNNVPDIKAFDVTGIAGNTPLGKYATSSSIIGFYDDVIVNEDELPVTSDGFPNDLGGGMSGLDLGVVYSRDLWDYMEENSGVGNPAPLDSYSIEDTFGEELYANTNNKTFFQIGVFTFAHSMQVNRDDELKKIWPTEGDKNFAYSKNNTYTSTVINQGVSAKRYPLTQITNTHMANQSTSQTAHILNTTYRNLNVYRYMITVDSGGVTYALVRNGAQATPKAINTTNFVIPTSELEYYTFQPYYNQIDNPLVPPYGSDAKQLTNLGSEPLNFTANNNTTSRPIQFAGYGKDITRDGVIKEIPRPLRILYQNPGTSTSFMASSTTTGNREGIRFIPASASSVYNITNTPPNSTAYSLFVLQRRFKETTNSSSYLTFSIGAGFSATNTVNNGTRVRLWAVDYANATTANYNKASFTPTGTVSTLDASRNVLFYNGTPTSSVNSTRYSYEHRTIESLEWSDNAGKPLEEVDKMISMATPTSYYYLNNKFWGVRQGLPDPGGGSGTINVPEGSIGFTVQPSTTIATSQVFVIVATDPEQDIDQEITISRFGSGTSQNSDRTMISRFVLPPVAGATAGATIPISVRDNPTGNYYNIYPNDSVLLVAYIFSVPVNNTVPITYFLEASQGAANFVYLSSERTAAKDNNPFHENDVAFPALSGIDFVLLGSNNRVATVGSPEYTDSLTSAYFGVTRNPNNLDGSNPALDALIVPITVAYDFNYAVSRALVYDSEKEKNLPTIFIRITITAPSNVTGDADAILLTIMENYNFNFSEWSYLDQSNYEFVYSDKVVMFINDKELDWTLLL